MIREEILARLLPITEEEKAILAGAKEPDKSLYMTGEESVIRHEKLLSEGKSIRIRPHTRFVRFPAHTHDYIEAVYMCRGETTHIINGKTVLLSEGELLFLGQNAKQEILPAGEKDVAVNFIIRPSFFDKTLEMLGAEETPIKDFLVRSLFYGDNSGYLHFKVAGVLPVQNLVENLIFSLICDIPAKRSINRTTMGLLFMHLIQNTDKLDYSSKEEELLLAVFRYIEENYKDGSLREAARLLRCDLYWLSREIKVRTGQTYTEHLQKKRLAQAEFLLKTTSLSVEEIAAAVGYENKSYFHRIFEKAFSVSPKKYRDEARRKK